MKTDHESLHISDDRSTDHLLDGRVVLHQSKRGYRVAIDPVFLAAAVQAKSGETVLDAGCGSAAAALCLAARLPDVSVTGLELQPEMVRLALDNLDANDMSNRIQVLQGDVSRPPDDIYERQFSHVMANPPYMPVQSGNPPPDPVRAAAMVEGSGGIESWISFAASVLKPKGSLTLVHRAERLSSILMGMQGRFGDIRVFPLWPGPDMEKPAKRILVQARKGINAPLILLPGMILHDRDGRYTQEADIVLRKGTAIVI